jgi:ribosomal-protein-alanine N-acetyltransferase
MPDFTPLTGKGFSIRLYTGNDRDSLLKHINHPSIYEYTARIPFPYTEKNADVYITHCLQQYEKTPYEFAIDVDGATVGGIGFQEITKHRAEIGYWLSPDYRERGIATDAVNLFTEYGFKHLNFIRLYAMVFKDNAASIRVLEKVGYQYEGLLRKHVLKDEKYLDVALYAKVQDV